MRSIATAILLWALCNSFAVAQSTPTSTISEADALMGGNFVGSLPHCNDRDICVASLNQGWFENDEYYWGVLHNNTNDEVWVLTVSVAIYDATETLAAAGDSFDESPGLVGPGGHALVGFTLAGELLREFTFDATIDYEVGASADGVGVPVLVEDATVRGDGILGNVTNTSSLDYPVVYVEAYCFADDGTITYRGSADIRNLASGDSAPFSAPRYDYDCGNFVVSAWGNPFA